MKSAPACSGAPVISVHQLSLGYHTADGWLRAVDNVCLEVRRGEILGLVGESGSGKTTLALQLLGYRHAGARQLSGSVVFRGHKLADLSADSLQAIRGRYVSYVPQNPTTALNPSRKVGDALRELLLAHGCSERGEVNIRLRELLVSVALDPRLVVRRYPHQLSGGQQQRVVIAMALACNPDLVVLDEPTTGLDVTTQKQILALLVELRRRIGTSMLYVTHDLGVVEEIADRVGVMYAGSIVEIGSTREIFRAPRHPYTAGLIASVPRLGVPPAASRMLRGTLKRAELGPGCPFEPRCRHAVGFCREEAQRLEFAGEGHLVACREWRRIASLAPEPEGTRIGSPAASVESAPLLQVQDISVRYERPGLLSKFGAPAARAVVENVSFTVDRGEVVALVGESGSGKSTIARAVSGLVPLAAGSMTYNDRPLHSLDRRSRELRRAIQLVFQNPDASLNPRRTVGDSMSRPLALFRNITGLEARQRVAAMLEEVQLPTSYAGRYPYELSGGERQRVAIGRALLAEPDLVLCDEILSALDVSVQANILEMLKRLRRRTGVAMIFISHDLAVVEQIAHRIVVLQLGRVVDSGRSSEIFQPPYHSYTRSLLESVPGASVGMRRSMVGTLDQHVAKSQ